MARLTLRECKELGREISIHFDNVYEMEAHGQKVLIGSRLGGTIFCL